MGKRDLHGENAGGQTGPRSGADTQAVPFERMFESGMLAPLPLRPVLIPVRMRNGCPRRASTSALIRRNRA